MIYYLSYFIAVSVQLAACLQDLEVAVPLDPQVVMDKEDHLLLVYFRVHWGLDSLFQVRVKFCVVIPNLKQSDQFDYRISKQK